MYYITIPIGILSYCLYNYRYQILDNVLKIKLILSNFFKIKRSDFILNKVLLYTDLITDYDVTSFFNKESKINKSMIIDIYKRYNILFVDNDNIRLKIFFTYKNKNYIQYFSYERLIGKDTEYYIPFPLYSDSILEKFRDDVVIPTYGPAHNNVYKKTKYLYSLFNIDSKNILSVSINNIINNDITKYFELIKTPFNDFGIAYDTPVKLCWILIENDIDLAKFDSLTLKFLNLYFDESKMDLIEHSINLSDKELNNIIISDRMKDIIKLKDKNKFLL